MHDGFSAEEELLLKKVLAPRMPDLLSALENLVSVANTFLIRDDEKCSVREFQPESVLRFPFPLLCLLSCVFINRELVDVIKRGISGLGHASGTAD